LPRVGSSPKAAAMASSGADRTAHKTGGGGAVSGSQTPDQVSARLLVDCMGHWSPIVRQMRGGKKPDGICLVVGGCASGVPAAENR
jgi:lycopene cyclase CruP